ncbi:MAG: serine/threonine protein kinase [Deltaproteobacteria bacterium]|nr:serine/threonine protein kinase [Deltaproteobacteria bacterium]
MALGPGVDFGAYTVLREIGRGGMAVVYEAEHRGLQKRVALKVLHTPVEPSEQRFLREGLAAARIHHEHIVEVHDTGILDGTAYLVMERLQGESLAAFVRREGPLDAARVADLLLPVVSALATAHDVGVVHRDIKPENIHLSRSRRGEVVPKVVDFGLARLNALDGDAQRLTGSAALVGTVTHMAPEQVLDPEAVSAASDQYALGVVMYECVTGQLPVKGPSVFATLSAILKGRFSRPVVHAPGLDPRLDDLIVRSMAREPGARFANLRALGAALLPLASAAAREAWSQEFGAPSTVSSELVAAPGRRANVGAGAALVLVALGGGALWFGLRRSATPRASTAASPASSARLPAPAVPASVAAPAPRVAVPGSGPVCAARPAAPAAPCAIAAGPPARHARPALRGAALGAARRVGACGPVAAPHHLLSRAALRDGRRARSPGCAGRQRASSTVPVEPPSAASLPLVESTMAVVTPATTTAAIAMPPQNHGRVCRGRGVSVSVRRSVTRAPGATTSSRARSP